VKYEEIENEGNKNFYCHFAAQIYKDCLYVYVQTKNDGNELWSFNLSKRDTWNKD